MQQINATEVCEPTAPKVIANFRGPFGIRMNLPISSFHSNRSRAFYCASTGPATTFMATFMHSGTTLKCTGSPSSWRPRQDAGGPPDASGGCLAVGDDARLHVREEDLTSAGFIRLHLLIVVGLDTSGRGEPLLAVRGSSRATGLIAGDEADVPVRAD